MIDQPVFRVRETDKKQQMLTDVDSTGPNGTAGRLADLRLRREETNSLAEKRAAGRQHPRGKLTARERIDLLVDPGSFTEIDEFVRHQEAGFGLTADQPFGDGVITGTATVEGREICLFSQDFSVLGGSMGAASGKKVAKIMKLAMKIGCPVVGFNDSGGARVQEGVASLAAYADIGYLNVQLSGVVPQLSLILGPCAGGASYSPAITDFVAMVEENSHMIVTGPDTIASVTGEKTTLDEIGGPHVCGEVNGNCHYVGSDENDAIDWIRTLLGYLPGNSLSEPPSYTTSAADQVTSADLDLNDIVPDSEMHGFDMLDVLSRVVDDGELLQVHERFAPNIICAFGRVNGGTVGVVANQPIYYSGVIDINASEKGARFIRFCDAFNIPILTFVDVPGFMPGVAQEHDGIVRRGPKLGVAYAEATVPMVTVVVRKAYGGGYALMGSKHCHVDLNLAWPTAEIAVMGATAAVSLLGRRLFAKVPDEERGARVEEFGDKYRETITTPYVAAGLGYIDRVIEPSRTRLEIREALRRLRNKREFLAPKKHGTTPL